MIKYLLIIWKCIIDNKENIPPADFTINKCEKCRSTDRTCAKCNFSCNICEHIRFLTMDEMTRFLKNTFVTRVDEEDVKFSLVQFE